MQPMSWITASLSARAYALTADGWVVGRASAGLPHLSIGEREGERPASPLVKVLVGPALAGAYILDGRHEAGRS